MSNLFCICFCLRRKLWNSRIATKQMYISKLICVFNFPFNIYLFCIVGAVRLNCALKILSNGSLFIFVAINHRPISANDTSRSPAVHFFNCTPLRSTLILPLVFYSTYSGFIWMSYHLRSTKSWYSSLLCSLNSRVDLSN